MSKFKSNTVVITFGFQLKSDGSVVIRYEGDDPRTFEIGDAVIEALAKTNNLAVTEVFTGLAEAIL